eukprot:Platyproteum_vivax@DN7405_c0_g2_i1.p1
MAPAPFGLFGNQGGFLNANGGNNGGGLFNVNGGHFANQNERGQRPQNDFLRTFENTGETVLWYFNKFENLETLRCANGILGEVADDLHYFLDHLTEKQKGTLKELDLSFSEFSRMQSGAHNDAAALATSRVLATFENLECLKMKFFGWTAPQLDVFCAAVPPFHSLKHLDVTCKGSESLESSRLLKIYEALPNLTTLVLDRVGLGFSGLKEVLSCRHAKNLEVLSICFTIVKRPFYVPKLLLDKCPSLKKITANGNGWTQRETQKLQSRGIEVVSDGNAGPTMLRM